MVIEYLEGVKYFQGGVGEDGVSLGCRAGTLLDAQGLVISRVLTQSRVGLWAGGRVGNLGKMPMNPLRSHPHSCLPASSLLP